MLELRALCLAGNEVNARCCAAGWVMMQPRPRWVPIPRLRRYFRELNYADRARHSRHPYHVRYREPVSSLVLVQRFNSRQVMESIVSAIKPSTATKSWNLNMIPRAPNKVYLITGGTQG